METRPIIFATILLSVIALSSPMYGPPVRGSLPDFSISPAVSSVTVEQSYSQLGTSVGINVFMTSLNGFAGIVVMSDSAPTGFSVSFSPSSVSVPSGSYAQSTVDISSTVVGTYNVTVTGTSGSLVHSTQITVTVTPAPPDFSISVSPSSMILQQGFTGNSTLTVTSLNGFSGTVLLTVCVNVPAPPCSLLSVTGTANPASVTLTSGGTATSTILIGTSISSTTGSYDVWIYATGAAKVHQAVIGVPVGPYFTMNASPSSATVKGGFTGDLSTFTLTSFANFSFTANFQINVGHSGGPPYCPPSCVYPTISFSPPTVSLAAHATGQSTLTIATTALTTAGTYYISVYGGGCVCSILPNLTITLTVIDPWYGAVNSGGGGVPRRQL